jgi:hypothetical protein
VTLRRTAKCPLMRLGPEASGGMRGEETHGFPAIADCEYKHACAAVMHAVQVLRIGAYSPVHARRVTLTLASGPKVPQASPSSRETLKVRRLSACSGESHMPRAVPTEVGSEESMTTRAPSLFGLLSIHCPKYPLHTVPVRLRVRTAWESEIEQFHQRRRHQ